MRTVIKRPDGTAYAVYSCKLSDVEYAALTAGAHPLEIPSRAWLVYWVEGPGATDLYKKWKELNQ